MNRREFLEKALVTCSAVLAFGLNVAKAIVPRKFLRATPLSKYPGRLKPLGNINSQSNGSTSSQSKEWSG